MVVGRVFGASEASLTPWCAMWYDRGMDSNTITINNRTYTIGRRAESTDSVMYEIIGKRGANGAIIVRTDARYRGRAVAVGIAALERLNWWDITSAMIDIDPVCAEIVASAK